MSDPTGHGLDAEVARILGWDESDWALRTPGDRIAALLTFHAEAGRGLSLNHSMIKRPAGKWHAAVIVGKGDPDGTIVARFDETGYSPGEALARATVAWARGQKKDGA